MVLILIAVSLCIIFHSLDAAPCNPALASEGSAYSLSADLGGFNDNFLWRVETPGGGTQVISNCSKVTKACDDLDPNFQGEITRSTSGHYVGRMTLSNVTRAGPINCETTWSWGWEGTSGFEPLGSCFLTVYHVPTRDEIDCQPLELDSRGINVTLQCTVTHFYPQPVCQFYIYRDRSKGEYLHSNLVTSQPAVLNGASPPYYSRSCRLSTPPVIIVNPGLTFFGVQFHPDVANGIQLEVQKTGGSMNFLAPVARMSSDCPHDLDRNKGYIRSESGKSCVCELIVRGYPPGRAQWTTRSHGIVAQGDTNGGPATLIMNSHWSSPQLSFTCNAFNSFRPQNPAGTLVPKIAYGPTGVRTGASEYNVNLCGDYSYNDVTLYCSIVKSTYNPNVIVTFLINGSDTVSGYFDKIISNDIRFRATYRPSQPGLMNVTCVANNSIFHDISAKDDEEINVREAPRNFPLVTVGSTGPVQEGDRILVVENQTLIISCEVLGGLPPVSSVSISCTKGLKVDTPGNMASLTLTFKKELNGLLCTCSAKHVTNCYNKEISFVINTEEAENKAKISLIIGVAVGGFVLLCLCAGIAVWIYVSNRRKRRNPQVYFRRYKEEQQIAIPQASAASKAPRKKLSQPQVSNPRNTNVYDGYLSKTPPTAQMAAPANSPSGFAPDYADPDQNGYSNPDDEGMYEELPGTPPPARHTSSSSMSGDYLTPVYPGHVNLGFSPPSNDGYLRPV